jgi:hypothetical protein
LVTVFADPQKTRLVSDENVFYGHTRSMQDRVYGVANKQSSRVHERWAQLRFSVIGRLLAAPPPAGELRAEIEKLAVQEWRHPDHWQADPLQFLNHRTVVLPKH